VVKNSLDPTWNENFRFRYGSEKRMVLTIMDWDRYKHACIRVLFAPSCTSLSLSLSLARALSLSLLTIQVLNLSMHCQLKSRPPVPLAISPSLLRPAYSALHRPSYCNTGRH
jgi:hypothetical protein